MFTRCRPILVLLSVGTGICSIGGCKREVAEQPTPPPRPNVILISIDTLRADHLGCYGYFRPTSPNIDRLATQGVRFDRAFSQASWTLPAHMSIMTSQYPHVHGVEEGEDALPDGATTLAEVLARAGYHTAGMVSWVWLQEKFGFAQGFEQFDELLNPEQTIDSTASAAFKAEQITDHAIGILERDRTRPLFLFVHYFDPHINYDAPEPFYRMFDNGYKGSANGTFGWLHQYIKGVHEKPGTISPRALQFVTALYDGEIRYTDTHIGRLIDAIDRTIGLDETLVVLTSDHGEELNEHGSMEGHQWTLYDEVVRVPLIIRPPGDQPGGFVVDTPVETLDVPRTILGLLDLPAPQTFQGRDRSAQFNGSSTGDEWPLVFGEIRRFNLKQYVRGVRYKLIHTDDIGKNKRGIPVKPGYELYDLQTDPGEQNNLFDPDLRVAKILLNELERRKRLMPSDADIPAPDNVVLSPSDIARLRSLGYMK